MNRELVNAIKQAHREMEEEKKHKEVHAYITSRIARDTPPGKSGAAKCGICDQLIMCSGLPYLADNTTPATKSDKE